MHKTPKTEDLESWTSVGLYDFSSWSLFLVRLATSSALGLGVCYLGTVFVLCPPLSGLCRPCLSVILLVPSSVVLPSSLDIYDSFSALATLFALPGWIKTFLSVSLQSQNPPQGPRSLLKYFNSRGLAARASWPRHSSVPLFVTAESRQRAGVTHSVRLLRPSTLVFCFR